MAILQELEQALINADAAGDVAGAEKLANAIAEIKVAQQPPQESPLPMTQSILDKGVDAAKSIGSGIARGLTGVAALPGLVERGITYIPGMDSGILKDLYGTDWGEQDIGKAKSGKYLFPGYKDMERNLGVYLNAGPVLNYESEYPVNKYLGKAAEWGTGGILSKPAMILNTAKVAGFGGLLSQGVEDLTDSPVAGLGVGIASTIPLTMLSNAGRSNAPRMIKEALGDSSTNKEFIGDAKKVMSAADEIGVSLTGPEASGNPSLINMLDLVRENRYSTKILEDFIAPRTGQIRLAVEQSLDNIATQPASKKEWAEKIKLIADDYITQQKLNRTKMSKKAGYTAADNELVSTESVNNILKSIDNAMAKSKPTEPVYQELSKIRNRLISKPASKSTILDASGTATTIPPKPEIRINILDGIKKDLREVITLPYSSGAKAAVKKIVASDVRPIVNQIDDVLKTNPNFKQASEVFKKQTETVINIIERNIGAINSGNITVTKILKTVFDPDNINANDVRKIANTLNKADPNAFPEISRMWLSNMFERAAKPNLSGGIPLSSGGKFANNTFSGLGSEQRKVFVAMLDGIADAKGLTTAQTMNYKIGFERMMKVLQKTGTLPSRNSATYSRGQMAADAGESTTGKWVNVLSTRPLEGGKRWLDELMEKKTMQELAYAFTDPNSIDEIIKLSKMSPTAIERLLGPVRDNYLNLARETEVVMSD